MPSTPRTAPGWSSCCSSPDPVPTLPSPTLRDLETDDDVRAVVQAFYCNVDGGIEADPLLGPFFAGGQVANLVG